MDNQNPVEQNLVKAQATINKPIIISLLGVIVMLLVAIVYLLTAKPVVSPVVENKPLLPKPESLEESDRNVVKSWQTYQNEKFGFELTLTDAWKGYKVFSSEGSQGVGSATFLQFAVPTVDKTKCVMQVTDEVCGYVAPFSIMVVNKDKSNVSTVDGKITEDKDRVYYYSTYTHFNALPEDVSKINFEIPKILSTFKFTDQAEASNWKTYTNMKDGYEIKYPTNFRVWGEHNLVNYNADDAKYERGNPLGIKIQIQKRNLTAVTYEKEITNLNASIVEGQLNWEGAMETKIESKKIVNFTHYNKVLSGPGGQFEIYYAPGNNNRVYFAVLVWGAEHNSGDVLKILSTFKLTN